MNPGEPNPADYLVIIPAAGSSRRMERVTRHRPKSLIEVGEKPILLHSLDVLAAQGFTRAVIITGYYSDLLRRTVGGERLGLRIEYAENPDYATTEHGYSLYKASEAWRRHGGPVVMLDADNLYDPQILKRLLQSPDQNVVTVDSAFGDSGEEEELVLGQGSQVRGFVRGRAGATAGSVGAFVGINRVSAIFTETLFDFMGTLLDREGLNFKYERVFDRALQEGKVAFEFMDCAGLAWININHEHELPLAEVVARTMR